MNQKEKLNKVTATSARFSRIGAMSLGSKIAMGILALVVLMSVLSPFVSPYGPDQIFDKWSAPSGEHLFGTDHVGRDIFARVLYGGRFSLLIGLCSTLIALFFGAIIGSVAAVVRKSFSEAIMRLMDIIMAVPGIAMAAVSVLVFGRTLSKSGNTWGLVVVIICSIAFVYIPQLSRIVRANVMAAYGEDYVRAVIVSGARAPWILVKHVMRNTAAPVLVFATVLVADAIILEASLTFIGSGLQATTVATWGNVLSEASSNLSVLLGKWWTAPASAAVAQVDKDSDREADKLLLDPRRAYAEQAESLQARLDDLEAVEDKRTDRFEASFEATPLLEVKDLCIKFERHGDVNVVDHVSFKVRPGETMGLVGESGCGKSITALTIMGLIDPKAEITGEILYEGENLLEKSAEERRALLGHEMAMIYQDALSSLNPAMLIRTQMKQLTSRGGTRSAEDLLELVGLDPKRTLESYPHELSGGQRQRVLIAMALTRDPKLIIADEPTTALDVTVQKQVIALLNELREKLGFAMIFVSHDLALVAEVAHHITVMYAGQVIEQAPTKELLMHPTHEYTRGLLGAVLSIEAGSGRLHQVPGTVPSPRDFPVGDRFAPRSSHPDYGLDIRPVLTEVGPEHVYAALPSRDEIATQETTGKEETR